ncbi:hypothetical protein DAPPUDRAFT_332580 [Daphnia pulex]|uniref:Uncharacterized protein n=1 Tax=Daphnia pulex TaxID=6669 RepID=E9HQC0_DAPPU|nr:hypothetical protein DAPPUDRAFT_332580 [Daphnia pulex]|eukprot:EFX66062.1 hypothetical protein DAPPUDRAFT_332580 [Daphnia pulex]
MSEDCCLLEKTFALTSQKFEGTIALLDVSVDLRKIPATLVQETDAQYTYEHYKKELGGSQYITGDARDKVIANLTTYLTQIKADPLVFDPIICLENYAKSLESQVTNQKDRTEKEVDKVRGEFSKKLADALVENTRLTAEIDDSTRTNYLRKNLITDLEEKLKTRETSSDDKTLILTKTELEATKQEVEIHKNTISDLNKVIEKLKVDTKDNVAQLTNNYKLLSDEHESLKNACTTTDSEVVTLTKANSQLTAQLNQEIATKQVSVDSLRQTNKGLNLDIATLQQQLSQQTTQVTQPPNMTQTPPTPPTAPIQNPLIQQQRQRTPSPDPNNVPLTKSHLRELYSQDERKAIPVFKGKRGEQLINNWLKDAERVAQSAGWTPKDKIKYFSDRLRGDAADWHSY